METPHPPTNISSLPEEVLAMILTTLTGRQKHPCLLVNRAFHDVALKQIFSVLHLFLGDWEMIAVDKNEEEVDVEEATYRRTLGMLACIAESPQFASAVRAISIYATEKGHENMERWVGPLCASMPYLTHLHAFLWHGTAPLMPKQVYESLVQHPKTLNTFRLPAKLQDAPYDFARMTGIKNLIISTVREVDTIGGYWLSELDDALPALSILITANAGTLRHLTLFDTLLPQVPVEVLPNLLSLELWGIRASREELLEIVFESATGLREFTLADVNLNAVAPTFARFVDALPNLTALKVTSLDPVIENSSDSLAAFLLTHPQLRFLDIDVPGMTPQNLRQIIQTLASMSKLEVLGMDARMLTREEDIEFYAVNLPRSLVATHTQSCWDNLNPRDWEIQALARAWARMPDLQYLHIENRFANQASAATWLAEAVPTLVFLGMADECWEIWRSSPEAEPEIRQLTRREILERTVDEVGDPEWSSLMRYHGIFDKVVDDGHTSLSSTPSPWGG